MNVHSPIHPPDMSTDSLSTINAANERATNLSAANACLKLIYQRRRQMARWARIGHHVWAWQEHVEIIKAKDRRRWYLARAYAEPVQFSTQRIDA